MVWLDPTIILFCVFFFFFLKDKNFNLNKHIIMFYDYF
jgi:hypothetical protein